MRNKKKLWYLHVCAAYVRHGPPPVGLVRPHATHDCDNAACFEPAHVMWGDRSSNEREKRDRLNNHATQKITRTTTEYIKRGAPERTAKELSVEFGISTVSIYHIRNGRQWADV